MVSYIPHVVVSRSPNQKVTRTVNSPPNLLKSQQFWLFALNFIPFWFLTPLFTCLDWIINSTRRGKSLESNAGSVLCSIISLLYSTSLPLLFPSFWKCYAHGSSWEMNWEWSVWFLRLIKQGQHCPWVFLACPPHLPWLIKQGQHCQQGRA